MLPDLRDYALLSVTDQESGRRGVLLRRLKRTLLLDDQGVETLAEAARKKLGVPPLTSPPPA